MGSGAYVRAQRDGKWINLEMEELTDEERRDFFKDRPMEECITWLNFMIRILRSIREERE